MNDVRLGPDPRAEGLDVVSVDELPELGGVGGVLPFVFVVGAEI